MQNMDITNANAFQSKLTGWFFISAAISSILGLNLYDPLLVDINFLVAANSHYTQIVFGAINELILVISAMGTAIMLFPILKRYNENLAFGYFTFRLLEVVFIIIGTVSVLTGLSVSEHYANSIITNKDDAQNLIQVFISMHKWTFMLGPNFMLAINTFIYSFVFYKASVIPKNIARLGLIAAILIMVAALLELFGVIAQISTWGILLAVPIAVYEMTIAVWFIRTKKLY
jgi:hypothetical protein